MIVVLCRLTVGAEQIDVQNVPKIYCSFISMLLQNAAKPSLILYHYRSYSLSLPPCSQHPLLALSPLSSLISPFSHFFFRLRLSSHFSPIFTFLLMFFFRLFSLPLHLPLSSLYPLLFLLLIFAQTSDHKAMRLPWWDIEGGSEGEKSGLACETEGDDERIRCFVWTT